MVTDRSPNLVVGGSGCSGARSGWTSADGALQSLIPLALRARTTKVYFSPFCSPVNEHTVVLQEFLYAGPLAEATSYPVIVEPLSAGAAQNSTTEPAPKV